MLPQPFKKRDPVEETETEMMENLFDVRLASVRDARRTCYCPLALYKYIAAVTLMSKIVNSVAMLPDSLLSLGLARELPELCHCGGARLDDHHVAREKDVPIRRAEGEMERGWHRNRLCAGL